MAYMYCHTAHNFLVTMLTFTSDSGCKLYENNVPLQGPGKNTTRDLSCSENDAYDTVKSRVKGSSQANVSCSENIAYATVNKADNNI